MEHRGGDYPQVRVCSPLDFPKQSYWLYIFDRVLIAQKSKQVPEQNPLQGPGCWGCGCPGSREGQAKIMAGP